MTDTSCDTEQHAARKEGFDAGRSATVNRWLLMAIGIVTILAGAVALVMPLFASLTAVLMVAIALMVSGVVGLVTALRRKDGWSLAASFALSLVYILGGVLMFTQPLSGILALTTVIIAYFAATGIVRLYYGVRAWGEGGGWILASAALSLLIAVLLLIGLPLSAAWVPGVMLAVDLIVWGALQIALAMRIGRSAAAEMPA